jgi:hypothetical protein
LLSQHPHAIRFWFGDRKQYTSDFGLMEEIVGIFESTRRFVRSTYRVNATGKRERG